MTKAITLNGAKKVTSGYPRFYIHKAIHRLSQQVLDRLRPEGNDVNCLPFPTAISADRCLAGLKTSDAKGFPEIVRFYPPEPGTKSESDNWTTFYALLFPATYFSEVMGYWRDTGSGMSSRQAESCLEVFDDLQSKSGNLGHCGRGSEDSAVDLTGSKSVVELPSGQAEKQALKTLIAQLAKSENADDGLAPIAPTPEDVFLFPNGMNAIYILSRALAALPGHRDVVGYGWLYGETRSAIERSPWDKVTFYHKGSKEELDEFEAELASGRRIQALFCECPGNPLLATPDLFRIHALATKYGFIVVCDDSVVTAVNIDLLPVVDIVLTSLTKMFSGACNVTAGSAVLNPRSPHYTKIKSHLAAIYEDTLFPLDAITLHHNSLDVVARIHRANANTLPVVALLAAHPSTTHVRHPSTVPTAALYQRHQRPARDGTSGGGQGQVLSVVFRDPRCAEVFYDALDVCKGTSFGTNFTLCIPFVVLAHYHEMDWIESCGGVAKHILRLSVGLEDEAEILAVVERALREVEKFEKGLEFEGGVVV